MLKSHMGSSEVKYFDCGRVIAKRGGAIGDAAADSRGGARQNRRRSWRFGAGHPNLKRTKERLLTRGPVLQINGGELHRNATRSQG